MAFLKLLNDVSVRLGINSRWASEYRAVMREKNARETQKTGQQILRLGMNCGFIGRS